MARGEESMKGGEVTVWDKWSEKGQLMSFPSSADLMWHTLTVEENGYILLVFVGRLTVKCMKSTFGLKHILIHVIENFYGFKIFMIMPFNCGTVPLQWVYGLACNEKELSYFQVF